MNKVRRFGVAMAAAMLVALSIGPGIALAADVQHGIGFTKGCTSPTKIGDPYACSYAVRNVLDEAHDTLTINSLSRHRPRGERRRELGQHHRLGPDHDHRPATGPPSGVDLRGGRRQRHGRRPPTPG